MIEPSNAAINERIRAAGASRRLPVRAGAIPNMTPVVEAPRPATNAGSGTGFVALRPVTPSAKFSAIIRRQAKW